MPHWPTLMVVGQLVSSLEEPLGALDELLSLPAVKRRAVELDITEDVADLGAQLVTSCAQLGQPPAAAPARVDASIFARSYSTQ